MKHASPFNALLNQTEQRPNLEERVRRIADLGRRIRTGNQLSQEELEFIGSALQKIADGENPYRALCLEVDKPGQRREGLYTASNKKRLALGWIAAASRKDEPESIPVKEAIAAAAQHFGYTPGTMKKMWAEGNRSLYFDF